MADLVVRLGHDLRLDPLALGAADAVPRIGVEAGQEDVVRGELHDPGLADLQPLRDAVRHGVERRRLGRAGHDPRLEPEGDRAVGPRLGDEALDQHPDTLARRRRGVVGDRAVRHVPERPPQADGPDLRRGQRDDLPAVLDHEPALGLPVEVGDLRPAPVVQEVARRDPAEQLLPCLPVGVDGGPHDHGRAPLRYSRRRTTSSCARRTNAAAR